MSVRFMDSFDHYATAQIPAKWGALGGSGGTGAMEIASARFGNGMRINVGNGTRSATHVFGGTASTIIAGFAYFRQDAPSTWGSYFMFGEAGVTHLGMGLDATNHLIVRLAGSGAILLTSAFAWDANWHYVELKMVIADGTGGSIQLRIDAGLTEDQTVSGIDTRNGGSGYIDRMTFGNSSYSGTTTYTTIIDDLYILDSVDQSIAQPGSPANNDFLGDIRVQALFPSGNGATSNLVGSDGNSTDNYLLVDETAPNTTDYVESATVGNKDTYAYGDLTALSGTVFAIQLLPYAAKTDAGSRQIKTITRDPGSTTEQDGPAQTLSTTYQYLSDIRGADPTGAAWTVASVNADEFGVKVSL